MSPHCSVRRNRLAATAPRPARAAFTLVELIACIAIIGVLAALLLASISGIRSAVQRTKCIAHLSQVGVAAAAYSQDNKGLTVPPAFIGALANYFPKQILGGATPWFCPTDTREKSTGTDITYSDPSYAYNGQRIGLPQPNNNYWNVSNVRVNTIEKPARTVYFCDASAYFMNKAQANRNADFRHSGRINALFFDGHVETLSFADPASFYDLL